MQGIASNKDMVAREGLEPPPPPFFRAKINSDYNNFVARVALEVVDSSWWKQQLRVKKCGSQNNGTLRKPHSLDAARRTGRAGLGRWL